MRVATAFVAAFAIVFAVTPAAAEASDDAPQSIWTKARDGAGSHLESGLPCPVTVGAFRLKRLTRYDAFGLDVGCDYWDGNAEVTVYLTKRDGQTLEADFAGAKSAIPTHFPNAKPVDGIPPAPSAASWLSAMFTVRLRDLDQKSGVWVTDAGGWTLKLRATYPIDQEEKTFAALRDLAAGADAKARPLLEACAKSAVPTRGATRLDDKALGSVLALAAMLTGQAHPEDRGADPVWCAERGIGIGTTPYLLWRNIAAGSRSADRIMVMTISAPVFFESVASPNVQKILEEIQQNSGQTRVKGALHQIMTFDGIRETVYASFDGRPDGEMFAQFVNDVRTGKAGAAASSDSSTKTISVAPP